jgi:hypothetical protein
MLRRAALLALALFLLAPAKAPPTWATWHTSEIVVRHGTPVFTVDGKPFFVYGAAFFYERTPRDRWRQDLEAYRALGINTIDLYLIWNWQEPRAGELDFSGRTNPRRNLDALFSIIHQLGFKVIVRPGPVIRNEWRNGGYPAWLLRKPAYDMPLHDILQGRYPATATLQNAHADAAAEEWLHNATHLRYAARWLHDVLRAIEPWSHDVIAVALDDDQGAYMDNDTWPAPHWHAYIDWLKTRVQATIGTRVPLFINTYQMKVTASAPVWAWGNWYQSDAYRIGEHDLAQLAFSTGLLQTQPGLPVMSSEFQAGWLQGAAQTAPRPAAPSNTAIALHEMLDMGVHGVVNFPVQDTLNPTGDEAPWANWSYAWDAALTVHGDPSPRAAPTRAFGALIRRYGPALATFAPKADLAIAWLGSAYPAAALSNADFAQLSALTIAEQQRCAVLALTCRLVDLRFDTPVDLARARVLVLPPYRPRASMVPAVVGALDAFRAQGGIVVAHVDDAAALVHSSTGGLRDAALLVSPHDRSGILDVFNPATTARMTPQTSVDLQGRSFAVPAMRILPGGARDLIFGRIRSDTAALPPLPSRTPTPVPFVAVPAHRALAYELDVYRDGSPTYVLDNGRVRVIVSANAGARAFVFENLSTHRNLFTSIGALRDDVARRTPPSVRDYIAPYTHPMRAGTFNRHYSCSVGSSGKRAELRCTYTAPDLATTPVRFDKTFIIDPNGNSLYVRVKATAPAVSISALAVPGNTTRAPQWFDVHYPARHATWLRFSAQGGAAAVPKAPPSR